MKRGLFSFVFLLIVGATIFAQVPVIVEAPPLLMMNPLTPDEVNTVGPLFVLSESEKIRVINKLALDKGMRDYEFTQRDWTNAEKTIALCEVLNIDWVVRPQLQKRANSDRYNVGIVMTAALLNVKTKKIIYSTPVVLKNLNEAPSKMKVHIDEIVQIINGATSGLTQPNQSSEVYKVGDRGPAGGWIVYDKGSYSDGWRYFELAPKNTETPMVNNAKHIEKLTGLDAEIGSGKKNTTVILQSPNQDYTILKVAKFCTNMEVNWFKDWFLPSQKELHSCTQTTYISEFAEFISAYYWCSNFYNNTNGYKVRSAPPHSKIAEDTGTYLIRAMRAF